MCVCVCVCVCTEREKDREGESVPTIVFVRQLRARACQCLHLIFVRERAHSVSACTSEVHKFYDVHSTPMSQITPWRAGLSERRSITHLDVECVARLVVRRRYPCICVQGFMTWVWIITPLRACVVRERVCVCVQKNIVCVCLTREVKGLDAGQAAQQHLYVCIYAHTCMHTHIYACIQTHTLHKCVQTCIQTCIYTQIYTYTSTHTNLRYAYTHTSASAMREFLFSRAGILFCFPARMYVCMCVCVCICI